MNKVIIATSLLSLALLGGCGGSSGNGGGNNEEPIVKQPFLGGVNGVDPVVKLTLKQPRSVKVGTRTVLYTSEGGHDGTIQYITQNYQNGTSNEVFLLATGVSSVEIKDVQRNKSTDLVCKDGSTLKLKIYSDLSSGEMVTTGTNNGINISCKSKFDSLLPTTVFDQQSITALLDGWGADYSAAVFSNCTHQIEDMDGFSKDCSGAELVNYTLTDTTGVVHKLTTKVSFE
ncbi:MAG: hypothetical protein KAG20_06825 [Cocleimonas sp.]|nr:hypothetical protein [Cocleimonas sp.]